MPNCQPLATITSYTNLSININYSPDGRLLATYEGGASCIPQHHFGKRSFDKRIRLWRVPNGQPLAILDYNTDYFREENLLYVRKINFSPNGKLLASLNWDNTIRLWSTDLAQFLMPLPIKKLCQQNREWVEKTLQDNEITEQERHWLEFIQALMNWHQRFDVEVENAPQLVSTGEFDIEIEG